MRRQSFKLPGGMPGSRDIKITDLSNWYQESQPLIKRKAQQKPDDWEIRRKDKKRRVKAAKSEKRFPFNLP